MIIAGRYWPGSHLMQGIFLSLAQELIHVLFLLKTANLFTGGKLAATLAQGKPVIGEL